MTQDSSDQEKSKSDVSGDVPQSETPKPRKVAKTLLVGDSPELKKLRTLLDVNPAPKKCTEVAKTLLEEPLPAIEKPKPLRKVSRTLLEIDFPNLDQIRDQTTKTKGQKKQGAVGRRQNFVAKTMLDHSVLAETRMKFEIRKEEIAAQQEAKRAKNPLPEIPPIDCKKMAQACPYRWEDAEPTERFRYCEECRTPIYNLNGLEQSEAEALVYTRENKEKPTFYKRPDGMYMTRGCPVGIKRKKQIFVLSIVAATAVLALLSMLILIPRPTISPQSSGDTGRGQDGQSTATGIGSADPNLNATASQSTDGKGGQQGTLQVQSNGTGKRKRPTFGPGDKDSYWQ